MIVDRPWGRVATYVLNQMATVRLVTVGPGAETGAHYHRLRDEMWVVLDRGLTVEIGNRVVQAEPGQEFTIPAEETHRVRCTGPAPGPDPAGRLRLRRPRTTGCAVGARTSRTPSGEGLGRLLGLVLVARRRPRRRRRGVPYTLRARRARSCSSCTGAVRCSFV